MSGSASGALTELLRRLVRIPSVNPMGRAELLGQTGTGEAQIGDFLEHYFRDLGVRFKRKSVSPGRDNLTAWYQAPKPGRALLFDAHQDTVPTDGMVIDPFSANIEGGRLYGRGACDVKAGMAAMLTAFARLVRERPIGSASLVMVCTVDEEYTHTGSSALAAELPVAIDLAVVAEPTSLNLINSHKGAVRWRVIARGKACHSSAPDLGDNAIYRMSRVVQALRDQHKKLAAASGEAVATLSVGTIHGGAAANIVPDSCVIELDRRVLPGEHPDAVREAVIEGLRAQLPDDFAHLEFEPPWVCMPALRPEPSLSFMPVLQDAVERATGRRPTIGSVAFGTDAGPLGQAGIPSVVFGPGDIAQAHTKDEWVDLDQVHAAAEAYFAITQALA
jgi:acetylornithine deacetylase